MGRFTVTTVVNIMSDAMALEQIGLWELASLDDAARNPSLEVISIGPFRR